MLSDVNLGANGTKYVKVDGKEWVVVVRGESGNCHGRAADGGVACGRGEGTCGTNSQGEGGHGALPSCWE